MVYQLYYGTGICIANKKNAAANNWLISDLGHQKIKIKRKM